MLVHRRRRLSLVAGEIHYPIRPAEVCCISQMPCYRCITPKCLHAMHGNSPSKCPDCLWSEKLGGRKRQNESLVEIPWNQQQQRQGKGPRQQASIVAWLRDNQSKGLLIDQKSVPAEGSTADAPVVGGVAAAATISDTATKSGGVRIKSATSAT